jgi:hypothetical protein
MQEGRVNILTNLERKMMKDIKQLRRKRIADDEPADKDFDIKELKRTAVKIRFWTLLRGIPQLFMEILKTHSDLVCYLLMLVSMMKNAGFTALAYPLIVFGYGLMEEVNPKKKFWYNILIYTMFLLVIKFVFQLQFWYAIFSYE